MTRFTLIILICIGGLTQAVLAESSKATQFTRSETAGLDLTSTENASLAIISEWGITKDEFSRYETLMHGPRGSFSVSNISPLEVLGIHARTPAERRQYADRLVRMLAEDTERVLAFEFETQSAWARLGTPLFDPERLPARAAKQATKSGSLWGKRLAVFVKTTDCPICVSTTKELVRMAGPSQPLTGLDIYMVDTDNADDIRAFARMVGIQPTDVRERRITLNAGSALYAQYDADDRGLPKVFVRDGEQLHALAGFQGALQPSSAQRVGE